jgi:CHAT domain
MGATAQIMLLPSAVADGRPQILLDDCGIWRDIPQADIATQSELKSGIEAHLRNMMQRLDDDPPVPVAPEGFAFRTPFGALYRELLPAEVRDELRGIAEAATPGDPPLLKIFLSPSAEWIPWELLHDGTSYLGLRFMITRLPILRQATGVRGSGQQRAHQVRSVVNLLAKDILDAAVFADWEQTFAPYAPAAGWEQRFPPDNNGGGYPTLEQMDNAKLADIIHFTCHGGLREERQVDQKKEIEYYWTLDHKNPSYYDYRITASNAQSVTLGNRPLVFGNACASIATQADNRGSLYGFGSSFMIGGALNFVGTLAPITKRMAVDFARRFYAHLFGNGAAPLPIAQALWATKRSFAQDGVGDPSYLFYGLYGPPEVTYAPGP